MIIYLAGGFTVTNVSGRERELSQKWNHWNRLFSFYIMDAIIKSEILTITKESKHEKNTKRLDHFMGK